MRSSGLRPRTRTRKLGGRTSRARVDRASKRRSRAYRRLGIAFAAGCASFVDGLSPQGPPAGSESALRLAPGPFAVVRREATLVDASRPTPANGSFAGAPTRTLATTLWAPESLAGSLPLVVYSHGFLSLRYEAAPLAEHLASHGYAVASVEFPLSNWNAPGGATLADASRVSQATSAS